ncbi:hypothetical protein [Thalassotalea crassostreae]|uniref:hypothetical protein n=1 Tax=Thalassotalea crassostreae TaxID=1763536 RepID=UPI0012FD740E|nr:hypothetical protein [Thalassotalea crassostreae]
MEIGGAGESGIDFLYTLKSVIYFVVLLFIGVFTRFFTRSLLLNPLIGLNAGGGTEPPSN